MSNITVLFHRGCQDGLTAAWAAWKVHPDAQFIGVKHGEAFPDDVVGRDIYLLDFCYPREELLELEKLSSSLFVLDHHITAYEDCGDLEFCHFEMNMSGAGLAWEFFHPNKEAPWLVKYIEYRDLGHVWTKPTSEHPENLENILAAVDSYEKSFEQWDKFYDVEWNTREYYDLITEGKALLRYQKQLIQNACKNAVKVTIKGKQALAVNACFFQSEIGNQLARQEGAELGVVWYQSHTGIKFSLRSIDKKADAAKLAQMFHKGGGHRNAAGFGTSPAARLVDSEDGEIILVEGWKSEST